MGEDPKNVTEVPSENVPDTEVAPEASPVPVLQKKSKKMLIVAAVILILMLLGGVLLWRNKHAQPAPVALTKVTVRLQWLNGAEFAGMYMAKDKGFYKDAGLDINFKEYEDGVNINKDVADGKADYGVNTPLEIVFGRNDGQNVKAIAAIYQVNPYVIAARKESNINVPADFKGKTLGNLGSNSEAKITYAALLTSAGLEDKDAMVKGVDFDPIKVFKDKDADTADIYRTDQTFLLDRAHIEYTLIYPEKYGVGSYGDMLITSDKKIKENPAQVKAFVSATLKGWQYAIDHQDEALTTLTHYENEAYKIAGYEKYVLTATVPLIKPTGSQALGSMDYTIWNRILLSAKTSGLLTKPMETQDLYSGQFIQ